MGFIEEQIQKNIANRVAIEKAMGKEFTESDCLDLLEKAGKAAQMGEVRTWGGKEYIKTPKGWRPKPKGYKEGEKKQEVTEAGNPVGKPESVTPKKVTDQLKVGDRVMYNGKEMTLTRISKDGRFQNGIEMKFVNEGDSTQTGGKTLLGNMMYAKPVKEEKDDRGNKVEYKDDMHEDAKRIAEGDKNEKREYASMDIKESKKFLVGKKITFKEYFLDGRGSYKDGVGEIERVRLYGKEKQPIAEIGFPNGDGITISLDQLDKREATGYKIEFDDNQK